jgi:nitroimidazol reductase NimA-like FMN-containing flavoprotein (pyridoxamine 5'-phosphate oxidase superfamily)
MRRKDREITDQADIEAILNEATVCRIGLADDEGPYIVPLSFGYENGAVYIHSAPETSKNLPGSLKLFRSSRISSLMTFDPSPVPSLAECDGKKNLPDSSRVPSLAECDGKKIAMIRKNPRCCFEVDCCDRVIRGDRPCSWGMQYRSVIGFGRAVILEDPGEKRHGLNCIMEHYGGGTHEFSDADIASVTVIRIPIESMTGKKHD